MIGSPTQLQRLYDVLDYLVDENVGVIRFVAETPREPGNPDFFHYFAQVCDTNAFSDQANFGKTGGASTNRGIAQAKAIGEGVERYCAAIYRQDELPLSSYADAPFRCVHPSEFALMSPEQFRGPGVVFTQFTERTPIRWAAMTDIRTGEEWSVPAAFVYVPYIYRRGEGDSPIAQSISTGLACHCSVEEATISAICEAIERDAFTITWQAMVSHPHIRIDSLSPHNRDLVARFERAGYEIRLLDMTMDHGVPTILAVSLGSAADAPYLVPAGSASLDPEEAVRKALEELEHTREYCQKIMMHSPRIAHDTDFHEIQDQIGHLNMWCDPHWAPLAAFLFASEKQVDFDSIPKLTTGAPKSDLDRLVTMIHDIDHKVLTRELTTPDMADLGLAVVRAVIPGFHPLVVGHHIRSMGGRRLWTVPQKLGHAGITAATGDNPAPHPYP
jgi:ribosomal protein S12 methylthiotransferase accessory factor